MYPGPRCAEEVPPRIEYCPQLVRQSVQHAEEALLD